MKRLTPEPHARPVRFSKPRFPQCTCGSIAWSGSKERLARIRLLPSCSCFSALQSLERGDLNFDASWNTHRYLVCKHRRITEQNEQVALVGGVECMAGSPVCDQACQSFPLTTRLIVYSWIVVSLRWSKDLFLFLRNTGTWTFIPLPMSLGIRRSHSSNNL